MISCVLRGSIGLSFKALHALLKSLETFVSFFSLHENPPPLYGFSALQDSFVTKTMHEGKGVCCISVRQGVSCIKGKVGVTTQGSMKGK